MSERAVEALRKRQTGDTTTIRYWGLSLVGGLAVIAAVAVLLETLARTVQQIEDASAEIWRVGKLIANNTVHIPLLIRTNQIVGEIAEVADGIARATERVGRAVRGDSSQ